MYVTRSQRNWRIHLVAAAGALGAGLALRITPGELAAVLLAIGLVLCAEALNTAVEEAVNASGAWSETAGQAKDAAAAAVLVAALTAALVALVVFGPPLLAILS